MSGGYRMQLKDEAFLIGLEALIWIIVMLQESHSSPKDEAIWTSEWGNTALFSHGSTNSKGVLLLFNSRVNLKIHKVFRDESGRVICVHVDIENNSFLILNLYAPNVENLQVQFYEDFFFFLLESEWDGKENIIIGGDFNCILDPQLDKNGGTDLLKKRLCKRLETLWFPLNCLIFGAV